MKDRLKLSTKLQERHYDLFITALYNLVLPDEELHKAKNFDGPGFESIPQGARRGEGGCPHKNVLLEILKLL